jgi:hypothetical protein
MGLNFLIFSKENTKVKFMDLLKETTIESIKKLPDGCSVEDIMYKIDFIAKVLDGLKDAEQGKLITSDELLKRAEKWGE